MNFDEFLSGVIIRVYKISKLWTSQAINVIPYTKFKYLKIFPFTMFNRSINLTEKLKDQF